MADIYADYERLNLKIGASIAEVKAAYRTLAKRWHPDQFSDLEQKKQAEEELKKINDAYQKIKAFLAENPSSQTEPNSPPGDRPNSASTTNHSPSESSSAQTRIYTSGASAAEAFYQAGAELTKAGKYEEAIAHFSSAIKLNPNYAEAYRHRGFVYSLMGLELGAESDLRKAKELGLTSQNRTSRSDRTAQSEPETVSEILTPQNSKGQTWQWIHPLEPHDDEVTGLLFSPNGKSLISASKDGSIKLWNPLKGTLLAALETRSAAIASLALSANGEILASANAMPEVKLWHLRTGALLKTLRPNAEAIADLTFHPHQPILIVASKDGSITFWDLRSGKLVKGLNWQKTSVSALEISPDGRTLAIASGDGSLVLWNLSLNRPMRTLDWPCGGISAMTFTADDSRLVLGCQDHYLRIWDRVGDRLVATLAGHEAAVTSISSGHSRNAVASGGDRTVRLWNLETRQLLAVLDGHEAAVTAIYFLEPQRILASGSADGSILIWRRTDEP
ncbi:tetratricopeptide repeat protein [Leptolyngbya sp. O-77]|uniref:WD40 domain-containing protein n=1 Tax=Leptolyngbya sp. O-77 TaxID=1080068 RepID=UPI00074D2D5E|nr:tetratricopeptide repeat protein [Leptolyngbya sp. O-77]BAU43135.1 chaperone protein DnaJ [Leptolyngbya sp. O-77]